MLEVDGLCEPFVRQIQVDYCRADLDEEHLERIRDSIDEADLFQPIGVTPDLRLVFGKYRLEACRELGWEKIRAFVIAYDDQTELQLAKVDENWCRRHLSVLEQCELLLLREEDLTDRKSRALPGRGTRSVDADDHPKQTTAEIAAEMGIRKRTYQRQLSIARRICPEARDLIRGTRLARNQRELEALARVPEGEQVAIAKLLVVRVRAEDKTTTVAAAVHTLRREKTKAAGGRFEVTGEGYRLVQAEPADWADVIDPNSVALIVTYIPEATGDAPIWDTRAPVRYTESVVAAHREVARMAAQALVDGGSLVVAIGSQGSDEILAAMRTHIDFVDSVPLLTGPADDPRWRSVLWFTRGEVPGKRLPLIGPPYRDSLVFDSPVECLSAPGETVFDPYGHCETATSAVCHSRRYIGFLPTPEDALSLHDLLTQQLEDL